MRRYIRPHGMQSFHSVCYVEGMSNELPYALSPADTPGISPELLKARHDFCTAYCIAKGWPLDPALWTYQQLAEILEHPGYPQAH